MAITIPGSFDLNNVSLYDLYIEIDTDNFSFLLSGKDNIYFHELNNNNHGDFFSDFQSFFFENDFLSSEFNKVCVINNTALFSFIPLDIYEEKNKEEFMEFNYLGDNGKLLSQSIDKLGMVVLHYIREDIFNFLSRSLVNPVFVHHFSPLLSFFNNNLLIKGENKMIVILHKDKLDIICYKHGNFILANQFLCSTLDDMVYFILFIWKQLKFNQMQDFIYIFNISVNIKLQEVLKEYVKNIIIPEDQTSGVPFEFSIFNKQN